MSAPAPPVAFPCPRCRAEMPDDRMYCSVACAGADQGDFLSGRHGRFNRGNLKGKSHIALLATPVDKEEF